MTDIVDSERACVWRQRELACASVSMTMAARLEMKELTTVELLRRCAGSLHFHVSWHQKLGQSESCIVRGQHGLECILICLFELFEHIHAWWARSSHILLLLLRLSSELLLKLSGSLVSDFFRFGFDRVECRLLLNFRGTVTGMEAVEEWIRKRGCRCCLVSGRGKHWQH